MMLCLGNVCRAVQGVEEPLCPVDITRNHTLSVNGAFESSAGITEIPEKHINRNHVSSVVYGTETFTGSSTCISGIQGVITHAFDQRRLSSEMGASWARPSETFDLNGYDNFNPEKCYNKCQVERRPV